MTTAFLLLQLPDLSSPVKYEATIDHFTPKAVKSGVILFDDTDLIQ